MGKFIDFFKKPKSILVEDSPSKIPPQALPSAGVAPMISMSDNIHVPINVNYTDNSMDDAIDSTMSSARDIITDKSIPLPSEPSIFHSQLLTLSTTLNAITLTKEISTTLKTLAYEPHVTQSHFSPIILELENYITSYQTALAQLKDSKVCIREHMDHFKALSEVSVESPVSTYETFNESPLVQLIQKQALLISECQKLLPELFSDTSPIKLQTYFQYYTSQLSKVKSVQNTIGHFQPNADKLRTDILSFTEAVNKLQSNRSLSVDWNGQKATYIKLRQELENRRNAYLKDEETLNTSIGTLYKEMLTLHNHFKTFAPHIIPLLETLHNSIEPDQTILAQRNQLNQTLMTLLSAKTQLIDYMNSL